MAQTVGAKLPTIVGGLLASTISDTRTLVPAVAQDTARRDPFKGPRNNLWRCFVPCSSCSPEFITIELNWGQFRDEKFDKSPRGLEPKNGR